MATVRMQCWPGAADDGHFQADLDRRMHMTEARTVVHTMRSYRWIVKLVPLERVERSLSGV